MYDTGSATGSNDLLTKLEAFMATNGWTTDSFATEGAGKRLHAHLGSVYFNARSYSSETPSASIEGASGSACNALAFNISTAGTGGSSWFDKTGTPVNAGSRYCTAGANGLTSAIPAYHFFAHNSGAAIFVVVEYASGSYQMFGFGTLNKYGSYTGGVYMFGSHSGASNTVYTAGSVSPSFGFFTRTYNTGGAALMSLSVDSETGWHWGESYTSSRSSAKRYVRCNYQRFRTSMWFQPNSLNGTVVLSPVECVVERDTVHSSASYISPIGEIPNVHYIQIRNLTPGQQITLGSDDYRVFPFWIKNAANDSPDIYSGHSGLLGFAVKE